MQADNTLNNKRIAKNAILLYFRMMFIILVSLYTSRVVLNTLGIEDYGIYNVVGGFVTMFGFLNTAMSSATQRYITFGLGKGNEQELKNIFCNCILTHLLICAIVFILAETIGLWFLFNKMVISDERMTAAFWVFQCSILSTITLIMSVPYNADIIAHERMSAFAYISIFEVSAKLAIVYLLTIGTVDKLILYVVLLLIVQCLIRYIYIYYCHHHFQETLLSFSWNCKLFKEMLSFAGWNLWGGISHVLYTQGVNVILNMFFGPTVNAARGLAVQVQSAITQFSNSFQMAINPQITKKYAQNELSEMHKLIFISSKLTFILLLILSLPIFIETEFIINIWLKTAPTYTVSFIRLILCIIIVDAVANPLMISVAATGKVRFYQSVIGGTMTLIIPVAYVILKLGANPNAVFITHLFFCLFTFVIRLFIVRTLIHFKIKAYLKEVLYRCLIVGIPSILLIIGLKYLLPKDTTSSICIILSSVLITLIFSYSGGLTDNERSLINSKVKSLHYRIHS